MRLRFETQNINFALLFRVMGWLLMIESAFMAAPTCVAYAYGESDAQALLISCAITLAAGLGLTYLIKPHRSSMGKREGLLLTVMVWVIFSFFGMLPFMLCSTPLGFTRAYFEAMAGFTTTGCTAYADVGALSHGINLWRALMQWIGGMGIILFTLAVLPMLNHSGGMQMFNAEVTGITHDKIKPRISQTAMSLWGVYFVLTLACAMALWAGPMSLFDAVCHSFGTVSTGGFSTRAAAVCDWDSTYIYLVITLFMFLGGCNFAIIFHAATGHTIPFRSNFTFRAYTLIILASTAVFVVSILARHAAAGFSEAVVQSLFQVVATLSSTGYCVPRFPLWGPLVMAMLIPLMFFGGCAGSTSGGAKIDRLIVLAKYIRNSLKRALQPNHITSVKIDGKVLPPELISKVIAFLCLYAVMLCTGALLLAACDVDIVDSFYCSLSCMVNFGVGPEMCHLGNGFSALPPFAHWVLSALMLIGRLEIFSVLVIFTPIFWRK